MATEISGLKNSVSELLESNRKLMAELDGYFSIMRNALEEMKNIVNARFYMEAWNNGL
jgi:hypothetical protein